MNWFRFTILLLISLSLTSSFPLMAQTSSTVAKTPPKAVITTKILTPQPIRISIDDLPPPFATESASKSPQVVAIPKNPTLNVPQGFQVNIFAENLNKPRWLALTPEGDVLVTETPDNRITRLRDTNGDGVVDTKSTFAEAQNGLDAPFGMAFADGYFFLGNQNMVRRYSYQPKQQSLKGTGAKIADLPGGGYNQHWTRNVITSVDQQKLYVSIGSRSNVDSEPIPRASIQEMNLDGSQQKTFAYGLRNPVGMDFHPITKQLYSTINERDGLGDNLVPDYLTQVQEGAFYGWPYTYFRPNLLDPRQTQNGKSNNPQLAAKTQAPDVLFTSHSAALGLKFYRGESFPKKYRQGAFVAFRGSWNRDQGTGYKIVFVPFNEQNRPMGYYEDFLTGFLLDPQVPSTWGRPVGLLNLPDGSLLFTEEPNGRIYRIQYVGS